MCCNRTFLSMLTLYKSCEINEPKMNLSVQKNLSAVRTVSAIRWSQPFERLELSVQQKLSVFGTVRAVPFKKIRQPFQLSVGKNKTVTGSFHWKVKCCGWSLCGDVFMSYCRGMSQLRSTQLFTHAKTFHRDDSWLLTATASHHD